MAAGGTKSEKVYCKPCFNADLAEIAMRDKVDLGLGQQNNV